MEPKVEKFVELIISISWTSFSCRAEVLEPDVKFQELAILAPNRPDLVLPIPFVPDSKGFAFALKDGSPYRLKFSFTVSNNIVSGFKYSNTVWKNGIRGRLNQYHMFLYFQQLTYQN